MPTPPVRLRLFWLWLSLCALTATGCCRYRGCTVDPTGHALFASRVPENFRPEPGCARPRHDAFLSLTPTKVIAPVGAEVVLIAGVCGRDGYLMANERIDWMLPPQGVGQFVALPETKHFDWLLARDDRPRKIDNTYLVSRTSPQYITLNRGTPTLDDDLKVFRGQAWTSVTSPVEGTSYVTAFAPEVYAWDNRQRTAVIHWVDAAWAFPPPAINPVGTRHALVTSVTRHTDQTPIVGWRVRYEVIDGPTAGFAPDGAAVVEVATDELGQARAELFQQENVPGTNRINVQVIRPSDPVSGAGERIVLGQATTTKTWTAQAQELSLRISGPAEAAAGGGATYRIEVANPSSLAMTSGTVTLTLPPGTTFSSATLQPTYTAADRVEWQLGNFGGQGSQMWDVTLRADRPGTLNVCAGLQAADGRNAQDCTTTTVLVGGATLDVQMTGPQQALVGDEVTFQILLTNRSAVPISGLVLVNRFDQGLAHEVSGSPIERDLPDLAPGQSTRTEVTFRATQPGQQCSRVEARGSGGVRSQAEACVSVFESQREQPAQLEVTKRGPARAAVGEKAEFVIDITNNGSTAVNNLRVVDSYDSSLVPIEATDGYETSGPNLAWTIDTLPPGRTVRLQVNCRCAQVAPRACNRVVVGTQEGARAQSEACVEVGTGGGALSLTVTDLRDFVAVGKELSYEILVKNNAAAPDQQVVVTVVVPPELTPVSVGTRGPSAHTIDRQTVRFEPVAEIRPQETLVYRIVVRAVRPGEVTLRALLRSSRSLGTIEQAETTSIFADR